MSLIVHRPSVDSHRHSDAPNVTISGSRGSFLASELEGGLSELLPLLGDEVALLLLVPLENLLGDLLPVGHSSLLGGLEVLRVLLNSLDELNKLFHGLLAVSFPGLNPAA